MRSGTALMLAILLLAAGAAGYAWWHQWSRGDQALAFWGGAHAWRIRKAPRVELHRLPAGSQDGNAESGRRPGGNAASASARERPAGEHSSVAFLPGAGETWEISRAPGISHVRQALIADASFDWQRPPDSVPPIWTHALRFAANAGEQGETVVLFDFRGGWVRRWGAERAAGLRFAREMEAYFAALARGDAASRLAFPAASAH